MVTVSSSVANYRGTAATCASVALHATVVGGAGVSQGGKRNRFGRDDIGEANEDITRQKTRALVGFRNAYVFDLEQTVSLTRTVAPVSTWRTTILLATYRHLDAPRPPFPS
jgi:hypothetical protein